MVRTPPLQGGNTGSTPVEAAIMHQKYLEVVNLRKTGKSYREIAKIVSISKNSISRWCKDLKLPDFAHAIIEGKIRKTKTHLARYNKQRHEAVEKEDREIRENNSVKIKEISDYELLLIGASLYWAEGYKRHLSEAGSHISFSNSDADMIKVFLLFLRKIIHVPEELIKARIHIYPNITKESAVDFWSGVTNISKNNFYFTTQVSKASQGKRPKNLLPYGTLEIRVSRRKRFFEVLGLIEGLIKQILYSNHE